MKCNCTVYIDPCVKILYSSYYIQGLYDYFGKRNVRFSPKPFRGLKKRKDKELFDHFMVFAVKEGGNVSRFVVDFWDKTIVDEYAYNWCDCYGKINVAREVVKEKDKLFVIPPGFGVRIWNKPETLYYCLTNFFRCKRNPIIKFSRHYEDYHDQFERPTIQDYEKHAGKAVGSNGGKPYVYLIGRLWPHKNCLETTNPLRLKFIKACKKLNVDFEGGLFAKPSHPEYQNYKEVVFTQKVDVNTYVQKTAKSTIVFNTPAVHDCHGWKLGEYLAMGKAIVSTKLSNYFPLEKGEKRPLHTVLSTDKLEDDVELVLGDTDYQADLRNRAKAYYQNNARPVKVIENLIKYKEAIGSIIQISPFTSSDYG